MLMVKYSGHKAKSPPPKTIPAFPAADFSAGDFHNDRIQSSFAQKNPFGRYCAKGFFHEKSFALARWRVKIRAANVFFNTACSFLCIFT
jgi:hypothetical protein